MPWVDADRFGPVNWTAHLYGILVFAIPNTLFIAAILFHHCRADPQHRRVVSRPLSFC